MLKISLSVEKKNTDSMSTQFQSSFEQIIKGKNSTTKWQYTTLSKSHLLTWNRRVIIQLSAESWTYFSAKSQRSNFQEKIYDLKSL